MGKIIKILLLEDNLHDAELINHQISKSIIKYQFKHVAKLNDFSQAIGEYIPDIILSDYNLPGFTGLDALEIARQKCPLIPFIIVTGTIDEETAAKTIKMGAWDYVVKERLTRLSSAMKNALELKYEKGKRVIDREKLRISEERYMLAIEGSQDGLWDWNLKTNEVYLSSRWKSMLGYNYYDIENNYNEWENLLNPDDKDLTLSILKKHLNKESKFYNVEYRLKCKDGSYKWVFTRGKTIFDKNGSPYRMAGSQTDISEQKLMEEKLIEAKEKAEENKEQFINLFDYSPVSLWENELTEVFELLRVKQKEVINLKEYLDNNVDFVNECASKMRVLNCNKAALDLLNIENKEMLTIFSNSNFTKKSYETFKNVLLAIPTNVKVKTFIIKCL